MFTCDQAYAIYSFILGHFCCLLYSFNMCIIPIIYNVHNIGLLHIKLTRIQQWLRKCIRLYDKLNSIGFQKMVIYLVWLCRRLTRRLVACYRGRCEEGEGCSTGIIHSISVRGQSMVGDEASGCTMGLHVLCKLT